METCLVTLCLTKWALEGSYMAAGSQMFKTLNSTMEITKI